LHELRAGIERSISLVEQCWRWRVRKTPPWPRRRTVDLEELAPDRPFRSPAPAHAKNLDLGLVTGESLQVTSHREPLHLILRNLLDNAIKYTPTDGAHRHRAGARAGCRLAGGRGQRRRHSGKERERVFDRSTGFRATTPRAGQGLAIVKTVPIASGAR
jgi:two-component system OmpR family sensor kinase